MAVALHTSEHFLDNGHGWQLFGKRAWCPERLDPQRRPVLIVPGYGMNDFIFGWHPQGRDMVRCLAETGLEVWVVTLRHQGRSRRTARPAPPPGLRAYALEDLPAAVQGVLSHSHSQADRVDLVGASLGGTVAYAHLALSDEHQVATLIAIGAPLQWITLHPLLAVAFRSRRLARVLPMAGVRHTARAAFPLLARVPGVLSLYMNTDHVDLRQASELSRTVDDPHPVVNRDIAQWVRDRDVVIDGVRVSEALAEVRLPLLVLLANRDGISPPDAVLSARDAWGGQDVEVLEVGTPEDWYAHADLFIAPEAPQRVFEPMAAWLEARA